MNYQTVYPQQQTVMTTGYQYDGRRGLVGNVINAAVSNTTPGYVAQGFIANHIDRRERREYEKEMKEENKYLEKELKHQNKFVEKELKEQRKMMRHSSAAIVSSAYYPQQQTLVQQQPTYAQQCQQPVYIQQYQQPYVQQQPFTQQPTYAQQPQYVQQQEIIVQQPRHHHLVEDALLAAAIL